MDIYAVALLATPILAALVIAAMCWRDPRNTMGRGLIGRPELMLVHLTREDEDAAPQLASPA